jgi:hypothetical protein
MIGFNIKFTTERSFERFTQITHTSNYVDHVSLPVICVDLSKDLSGANLDVRHAMKIQKSVLLLNNYLNIWKAIPKR